jgi:hypothetical protein
LPAINFRLAKACPAIDDAGVEEGRGFLKFGNNAALWRPVIAVRLTLPLLPQLFSPDAESREARGWRQFPMNAFARTV